jgi:hypothetical protein
MALVTLTEDLEISLMSSGTPTDTSCNTKEDSGTLVNSVSWLDTKHGYFENLRTSQG